MKTQRSVLLLFFVITITLFTVSSATPQYKAVIAAPVKKEMSAAEAQERERQREECLRLIRGTSVDLILAGTTADELPIPCSGVAKEPLESALNDILVEWKSRGLPERLQKSSPSQLQDLLITLEKAILKLDLKAGKLKDAADADARRETPPLPAAPTFGRKLAR